MIQVANTNEAVEVEWDVLCDEWVAYDIDEMPHWGVTRTAARNRAIEANNVILEHLAKCPTDAALDIEDMLSDDWMVRERDEQEIADEELRMYADLRYGL